MCKFSCNFLRSWGKERRDVDWIRYILDTYSKLPYHSLTEEEQEEIWDDGLHFTPKGYERLGQFVAARLLEILLNKPAAEEHVGTK